MIFHNVMDYLPTLVLTLPHDLLGCMSNCIIHVFPTATTVTCLQIGTVSSLSRRLQDNMEIVSTDHKLCPLVACGHQSAAPPVGKVIFSPASFPLLTSIVETSPVTPSLNNHLPHPLSLNLSYLCTCNLVTYTQTLPVRCLVIFPWVTCVCFLTIPSSSMKMSCHNNHETSQT